MSVISRLYASPVYFSWELNPVTGTRSIRNVEADTSRQGSQTSQTSNPFDISKDSVLVDISAEGRRRAAVAQSAMAQNVPTEALAGQKKSAEEVAGKVVVAKDGTAGDSAVKGSTEENGEKGQAGLQAADQLSDEERAQVDALKKADRQVRAHEQAHLAAAGGLARGGARLEYESGPDGQRYAVAGEVNIDASPVNGDPQATLIKAGRIRQAALAPADPSAQDRRVAAQASAMAAQASQELAEEKMQGSTAGAAQAQSSTQTRMGGQYLGTRLNVYA